MEEAKVSSNRIDQIVVIVLLSAAVAIVTALSVYYLIMMHTSANAMGQAPVWLFLLAWVFAPLGGGILIILGIWQKVVRHDTLGWYGGIIGVGTGMIVGYVTFFIVLFLLFLFGT